MHLRVGYTNQKKRLRDFEIEQIVTIFRERKPVDNFSVCVSYDDIRKKRLFPLRRSVFRHQNRVCGYNRKRIQCSYGFFPSDAYRAV